MIGEFTSLSNVLSVSHVYETGMTAATTVRVTNAAGNVSAFARID